MAYDWGDNKKRSAIADEAGKRAGDGPRLRASANEALAKLFSFQCEERRTAQLAELTDLRTRLTKARERRETYETKQREGLRFNHDANTVAAYGEQARDASQDVARLEAMIAEVLAIDEESESTSNRAFADHESACDCDTCAVYRTITQRRAKLALDKAECGITPTPEECIALGYARAKGWSP